VVVQPPALAWAVKTVADAVAENRDDAPLKPDPWKGIFKPNPVAADDEDI
jgi:hypothetical protein